MKFPKVTLRSKENYVSVLSKHNREDNLEWKKKVQGLLFFDSSTSLRSGVDHHKHFIHYSNFPQWERKKEVMGHINETVSMNTNW